MNNVFLDILPSIDLHGYPEDMIEVLISDFILENIRLKKYKIVIIHGKGFGILKNKTHELLRKDKRVSNYRLDSFNTGCTVVELNKDLC